MFRRDKDARRTAKAVRDHKDTMDAFARASLANTQDYSSTVQGFTEEGKPVTSKEKYSSVVSWRKPEGVRTTGSLSRKVDDQKKKGLITQGEAENEKLEISARKGNVY